MKNCIKNDCFVLYQKFSSRWDGVDWLSISFSSETQVDFTGFSAKFKIGQYVFENNDLTQPWIINLTDEQTATLPLGMNTGSLIVYDTEGAGKPFTTTIPVLVKDWVDGDVEIDTYNATILATLDNQNEFIVNVETAKVSLDWVNGKISEHNNSSLSHPYILGLIDDEKQARINVDNQLSDRIDSISGDLSNYRTAAQQDIIDNAQNEAIASKQSQLTQTQLNAVNSGITSSKVSTYDNHVANTIIHVTAQDKTNWNGKQNAISDLDTIRSGASAGASAVQPNDMTTAISTHNTSSQAHADIRELITTETTNRENADIGLQSQIDAIVASSDVTDIVGTYAQLQAYDTSSLPPNSIIKVLQDESRDNETTYYRWVVNGGVGSWVLIGEEGPYYTKSEADSRFATAAQGAKADTALQPSALNGYATEQWVTNQGYITGITSAMITTALGYTPYNSNNPAGYITSAALNGYATEQYVDDIVGDIETILHNINSGS